MNTTLNKTAPTWKQTVIILAGSSESGKSTAGVYLASMGAERIKIRNILLGLTSGKVETWGSVQTRVEFHGEESFNAIRDAVRQSKAKISVLESFIDPELAIFFKKQWDSEAVVKVLYVDAPESVRLRRFQAEQGLSGSQALAKLHEKDKRKGLPGTIVPWKRVADFWIDNDSTIEEFKTALDRIVLARTLSSLQ